MDQATHPPRYFACNRERAPMRRGRLGSLIRRASMRRGPTELLRLSLTGDSKRGRAAAPFCVDRHIPHQGVGGTARSAQYPTALDRTPGPQRRTGRAFERRPAGRLSFYRRAGSEQPGPRPLRRRRLPAGDAASSLDQDSAEHDNPVVESGVGAGDGRPACRSSARSRHAQPRGTRRRRVLERDDGVALLRHLHLSRRRVRAQAPGRAVVSR